MSDAAKDGLTAIAGHPAVPASRAGVDAIVQHVHESTARTRAAIEQSRAVLDAAHACRRLSDRPRRVTA